MPTLFQIATYSRLFQLLRGRRPTASEVRRYFDGEAVEIRVRGDKRKRCPAHILLCL